MLWTVLVLGTVAGGFFLVRDVWRKGKALLAELDRAQETLDRLESTRADLEASLAQAHPVAPVAVGAPEVARAQRAAAAEVTAARAARRQERRRAAYSRWLSFSR